MSKTKASIQTITEVYFQLVHVFIHDQVVKVMFAGLREGGGKKAFTVAGMRGVKG